MSSRQSALSLQVQHFDKCTFLKIPRPRGVISKTQFNGIGGLRTYIRLTPNADASALGSYGDACIAPPPKRHGESGLQLLARGVAAPRNDVERTECRKH